MGLHEWSKEQTAKMKLLLYIALATFTAFYSCSKSRDLKEEAGGLKLHECLDSIIAEDNLKLCFDAVISDSRCPANAMCVWQGTVVAKFIFTKNSQAHTLELSTLDMPPTYNKDTVLMGYKIEFITLAPYPGTVPFPIPDNQKKAEVKITKI